MKQEKEKKLNKTFFFKTKDHTLIECFSLQMKYKRYWYSGNTTKSNIIFDVKNGCTPTENGFQNKGLIFFFFWTCPWHVEVPGPGIKPALQLLPVPQLW